MLLDMKCPQHGFKFISADRNESRPTGAVEFKCPLNTCGYFVIRHITPTEAQTLGGFGNEISLSTAKNGKTAKVREYGDV